MKKSIGFIFIIILLTQCSPKATSTENQQSNDYDELCTIASDAEAQYILLKDSLPPLLARETLVTWLLNKNGVIDAGFNEDIDDDENTVWFIHSSGLPGAILTENSFVNGSTDPLPARSAPSPALMNLKKRSSSSRSSSNTGMTAWLISPFYTENSTDDVIYSLDDFYEIPSFGSMVIPFIDSNASIAVFQAAIIGSLPPAVHLTIITHGGRTRLQSGNPKVSFVMSGEYKTASTWNLYSQDLLAKRIVTIAYKGKLWLSMTPDFFAHYSGDSLPGDDHWMARYVHFLACYSYKDNGLHDAFMNNGAQAFSGFTRAVGVQWGNNITLQYFEKLSEGEGKTISEARNALSATVDPDDSRCTFEHSAKNIYTRYFYRASVTVGTATYLTPTYAWPSVFNYSNTNGGYYFLSPVYHSVTNDLGGELTIIFESTSGGNVSTPDTVTKLMFEESSNTWYVDYPMWQEHSFPGVVTVTTFQNANGGQVKGTFSGTLGDSISNPTPNTKTISGSFELIRSFGAGP